MTFGLQFQKPLSGYADHAIQRNKACNLIFPQVLFLSTLDMITSPNSIHSTHFGSNSENYPQ